MQKLLHLNEACLNFNSAPGCVRPPCLFLHHSHYFPFFECVVIPEEKKYQRVRRGERHSKKKKKRIEKLSLKAFGRESSISIKTSVLSTEYKSTVFPEESYLHKEIEKYYKQCSSTALWQWHMKYSKSTTSQNTSQKPHKIISSKAAEAKIRVSVCSRRSGCVQSDGKY